MSRFEMDLPPTVMPERVMLFVRLQQLEMWLRELVYMEMKCNFADAWWDKCDAALRRSKRGGIPARKSLESDKKHPHMATPENDPLWFISFDALLTIVFDRYFWHLFSPCLTTKHILRAKFDELTPIRNRIAHTRSVHTDDLSRVERVMRDLDRGFWTFCTSYNGTHHFSENWRNDAVFRRFVGPPSRSFDPIDRDLTFGVRPFCKMRPAKANAAGRGVFYRATFSVATAARSFDLAYVLSATEPLHNSILYFHTDMNHSTITVTLPSLHGTSKVISILDAFYSVCEQAVGPSLVRETSPDWDPKRSYEDALRRAAKLNAQWPHYVLTSTNPLTFLYPDMACSFFEV